MPGNAWTTQEDNLLRSLRKRHPKLNAREICRLFCADDIGKNRTLGATESHAAASESNSACTERTEEDLGRTAG